MFFQGDHKELRDSIETIGVSFAVFEYDSQSNSFRLISCNSRYEEIPGKPKNDMIGQALQEIFPKYAATPMIKSFMACKKNQIALETEILFEYKGLERIWKSSLFPIVLLESGCTRIFQTCVEMTEKAALDKQFNLVLKRLDAVDQSTFDGIITIDEHQKIKRMNESAKLIFGSQTENMIGKPLTILIPKKIRKKHREYVDGFKKSPLDSRPMQNRVLVCGLKTDGTEFPIEVNISKIQVNGRVEMIAVIRDISEKERLIEELLVASQEDTLTRLLNRKAIGKSIENELSRTKRFGKGFVLLMIDIDYFKSINEQYGHECGDKILVLVSQIIKKTTRETDQASRWGGEKFLVLLPECGLDSGILVGEKIRSEIESATLKYNRHVIQTTVSIGVEYFNAKDLVLDDIVHEVNQQLFMAKKIGGNQISFRERPPSNL